MGQSSRHLDEQKDTQIINSKMYQIHYKLEKENIEKEKLFNEMVEKFKLK